MIGPNRPKVNHSLQNSLHSLQLISGQTLDHLRPCDDASCPSTICPIGRHGEFGGE